MKRSTIVLNGQEFKTQGQLKEFVRQIVDRYNDGDILNLSDLSFCKSLLERHPESIEKIGSGVKSIRVSVIPPWKSKGFILTRTDGTEIDFSFRACVSSKAISHKQKVNKAARTAVHLQIVSFKKSNIFDGFLKCAITGQFLSWDECDIDHYPIPFADLLERYMAIIGSDFKDLKVTEDSGSYRFIDSAIDSSFRSYHLENAGLRPLRNTLNATMGRHDC